jgi:ABC-2 type transport system ATP-binding protein
MRMTDSLAIIGESLTVVKDKKPILVDLNFKVSKGSITGLIGPSGSGKTTLMRAIVGVQDTSEGSLTVLEQKAGSRKLRRSIGYVTQSPAVYTDLTIFQNLLYFGALVNAKRVQIEKVIKQVQLQDQREQLVESLSGGQKARVSLAIALLGDPDLYVLDEPTVGLDPVLRNELWDMFKEMAKDGKTLLVSSHVMDEAERCKNLILLRDGKILWNDTRDGLLEHTKKDSIGDAFIAMIKKTEDA